MVSRLMADFVHHIDKLIKKEGGYQLTNDPDDRGGRTYAGISERANPRWEGWRLIDKGADGERLKDLVRKRYRLQYWNAIRGDELGSDELAEAMLSCSVLSGPLTATILAQTAVGAKPDGIFGPMTLGAVNSLDIEIFLPRFVLARIARYAAICNDDRSQKKWLLGWLNRSLAEVI